MERFTGKSVLVTGGASGLGADIVRRFVREGAQVVIGDINPTAAAALADELGERAQPFHVDLAEREQIEAMIGFAQSSFGGLDILVNNAGVHHLFAPMMDLPISEFDRMMAINAAATIHTAQTAVPLLRQRPGASICTVASIGAIVIRPGASMYAASKAASIALTKSLAMELAPEIRVNCVLPTSAATGLLTVVPGADQAELEKRYARNAENLPMRRLCTGADVAAAIAFLSSDDASFITGVALPVDGGRSAGGA